MPKIKSIMTTDVETISSNDSIQQAAKLMQQHSIGVLPVCEGNRVRGIVTDRDIAIQSVAEGRDPSRANVKDIMSRDLHYCFEDEDIQDAAHKMKKHQVRRLLVLDRERNLSGILSLDDLAARAAKGSLSGETLQGVSQRFVSGATPMKKGLGWLFFLGVFGGALYYTGAFDAIRSSIRQMPNRMRKGA